MAKQRGGWRGWLRLRRLVPLVTIFTALAAGIAAAFGLVNPPVIQGVIVSLLGLLALDAIVERVGIVERIEQRLSRLEAPELLRDRSKLTRLQTLALGATEIDACGPTLVSLVTPNCDFLSSRLDAGARVRLLVLDERSNAWKAWNDALRAATPADLASTLIAAGSIVRAGRNIEVRLAPFHLPVSLVIADGSKETGRMNVELAFTAVSLEDRPHMYLTRAGSPDWFEFFRARFEYLWDISKKWEPSNTRTPPSQSI